MPASVALTTLPVLKLYMGIADTTHDELLDKLIGYARARIEEHCAQRFAREEMTEYLDGSGYRTVYLSRWPVTSLIAIYEDANRAFGPETEITDANVYPDKGTVMRRNAIFAEGCRTVKVTYTAGYEIIPEDLESACVKLAAY